jgi:SpoIIAA-like
MIERMQDMPAGTIGFRVAGEVEPSDYTEVLAPVLHGAIEAGEQLRTLYLIEGLDEIEPAALWEDAKLGVDLAVLNRGKWVRSAIVTDLDWMTRATRLFAWMIPGEARAYPVGELAKAKEWVAG